MTNEQMDVCPNQYHWASSSGLREMIDTIYIWRPYRRHKQCGEGLNRGFGYGAVAGVLDKEWMPALYTAKRLASSKYYLLMN